MLQSDIDQKKEFKDNYQAALKLAEITKAKATEYNRELAARCDHILPNGTSANDDPAPESGFGFFMCSICGYTDL